MLIKIYVGDYEFQRVEVEINEYMKEGFELKSITPDSHYLLPYRKRG